MGNVFSSHDLYSRKVVQSQNNMLHRPKTKEEDYMYLSPGDWNTVFLSRSQAISAVFVFLHYHNRSLLLKLLSLCEQLKFYRHYILTMAVFTLEEEQIIWMDKSSGVWPSDVYLCRQLVRLDGQVFLENRLSRPTNFRWFVRRKICLSRLHIRGFVRPGQFVRTDALYVL